MVKYVIITPAKDEECYIQMTIESVVQQTIRPLQWIIVDDGSVDRTREVIETYSRRHGWIKLMEGGDQGARKPGLRHLRAFYKGYAEINGSKWDFLVKLDADLSFEKEYFEKCFLKFRKEPKLGIGGGIIVNVLENRLIPEKHPLFHVRGATKIYRRECWDAIGGLPFSPCYDTLDEMKANMLGYETRSFPDLRILHHRYTGKAYGKWGNSVKNGLGDYISGYHPIFMVGKCVKRLAERPFLLDSIGLMWGYLSGYLRGVSQVNDRALIEYVRQQQLRRLTLRESLWK